ncbi:hypothetical protein J7J37_00020 [bacterium]|nr:hypothetical protein [bacterium]
MFKEKFPTSPIKPEKEISPREKEVKKREVETVDLGIEIPEEERKFNKEFVNKEEEALEMKKEEPSRLKKLMKKVLCGITAGVILMGAAKAYAESPSALQEIKPKKEVVEVMESKLSAEQQEKLAVQTIENLASIPETQSRYAQEQVAKSYIYRFAAQIKSGEIGPEVKTSLSPTDVKKALEILNQNIGKFADQKFGNADGNLTMEEMMKFREKIQTSVGLKKLLEMIITYKSLP